MLIAEFFFWHYSRGVREILLAVKNFIKFYWKFFSINILVLTIISPWRKDISFTNWRGLRPLLFLNKLFNNVFSRVMGAIARTIVISLGLSAEIVTLALAPFVLIYWMLLPILLFTSTLFFLINIFNLENYNVWTMLGSFIFLTVSLVFSWASIYYFLRYERYGDKRIEDEDLNILSRQEWFSRVWNRMGFSEADANIINNFSDEKALEKELRKIGLSLKNFKSIIEWEKAREIRKRESVRFWSEDNLKSISPIGKYWHFGYTVKLDKYSVDLPRGAAIYNNTYAMGREKDIEMAEIMLSRPSQNSILLIGDPGIGKKTLVNLLAKKIKEEKANPALKYKRIVEVQLDQVISEFKGNELMIELNKIFGQAAFAGNVVIFINNIHEFLSAESKLSVDISPILLDFMTFPTFQIIGTTTSHDFHKSLENKASLMKYMDKIILEELSQDETKIAMLNFLEKTEKGKVLVTYQAVEEIVKLTDQFITDMPMPEKAIDVLEESLVYWGQNSKNKFVLKKDVDKVFSDKTKIPVGEIGSDEQQKLMNLESVLKQRVIGQDEVIKQISQMMVRARSGISDKSKPIGSFLFMGPTGVGKTETAKALAEAYFGDERKMIRLDMSEYQRPESVENILGQANLGTPSKFLSEVSENPFSVVLFDEIEKAYREILNLFLQILDEGWITDAFGKKIIFKNAIIIATSNVGAEIIKDGIESGYANETIYKHVIDYAISKGVFTPEFLNRFESVLFFRSLEGDQLKEVTSLMMEKVAERIFKNKNIRIHVSDDLLEKIIQKGYDPIFGARSIKRFIQDKIEDVIAKKIVEGTMSEGQELELQADDI